MRPISYYTLPFFILSTIVNHVFTSSIEPSEMLENILQHKSNLIDTVKAFEGIIFEDFSAEPYTQRFNGSLAIGGNFSTDGFLVNHKNLSAPTIQCIDNTTLLDQFGLVVGGSIDVKNTTVNGALSASDAYANISSSCVGSSYFPDFDSLFQTALNVSQFFANQTPNLVIRDGGYLSDGEYLGKEEQQFYTLTFDKCHEQCRFPSYLYSDPEEIFHGANWTGPYNTNYLTDKPIIFNIPVRYGNVFNMYTENPAAGLEDAFVIYNVYPVTETGEYDVDGHFVWIRNTTHDIPGFTLAPSSHVIESNWGGFKGNLITSRYLSVADINSKVISFFTE